MDSDTLYITTDQGEEKEMKILFTFDSEQYGKSYVLFYNADDDAEIFCMSYDEDGNLTAVEDEAEWEMIEEVLEVYQDGQENEEAE
ncbi:MAG: DUF1292 domain-containing protein [Erysipelotrichaceae bacterium]|nr:DUF1292 domain-containing protein [Erysipelotrichaceae bacterium]